MKLSKKNNEKSFIAFIVLIVLVVLIYSKRQNTIEFIRDHYNFAKGKITRAYILDGGQVRMDYKYYIDGVKFMNTIAPNSTEYYDCYKDFEICDTVEFWVIYSNKDHQKSMIDLTESIKKGEDPKETRNLINFKF
jgi:hypothetical protein